MTWDEFKEQSQRLFDAFGTKPLYQKRATLIWHEVSTLPVTDFAKMVDEFIGNSNFFPTMEQVLERRAKAREKQRYWDKINEETDAKQAMASSEVKYIIQSIMDRINGKMTDEEWNGLIKGLNEHSSTENPQRTLPIMW